ncbi:hypothetical protein KDL30_11470, partial [bacterium]|nr:hypothetical protein [bacterium]
MSFLDLPDRDVVVIDTGDLALKSDMMVNKLSPSRLEVLYRYDGQIPAVPQTSGDLVTSVDISPRSEGFMLVLTLSDSVPTTGEAAYRETPLGNGRTAIEVFSAGSTRSAFDLGWLDNSSPLVPLAVPAAAPAGRSGYSGAEYDAGNKTLVISGVGTSGYEVKEHDVVGRVDVLLANADSTSASTGMIHKSNDGAVTFVDVVQSKVSDGLVVRARMGSEVGLVRQEVRGDDLYLTFGNKASSLTSLDDSKPAPLGMGTSTQQVP